MGPPSVPPDSLDPAFRLALRCCQIPSASDGGEADLALLKDLDTGAFLNLVLHRHRIGPLAHAMLSRWPKASIPDGLRAPLAQSARANAMLAMHAQRAHRVLGTWFADAGVDWMPFKGVTLAVGWYEDPSMRHVNDLDLWVPPGSLHLARAVLVRRGCRMPNASLHADLADRGPRHDAYLQQYYHEMQFHSPEVGAVELHWRLADNPRLFALESEDVRARAGSMTIAGVTVPVMDDIDLLLYLCDHGARHGWGRLKWLADLPRLLARRAWNWDEVFARSDAALSRHTLSLGLALCIRFLGWEAPDEVHRQLAQCRRLPAMMRLTLAFLQARNMEKDQTMLDVATSVWRELRMSLLLNPKLTSIAFQARRYLLSPKDLQAWRLPDRLFPAYYLLRPLLLIGRRTGLLGVKAG